MIEWANRAGDLVFQDIQNLHKENMVTFNILGLFWYIQGSWKLSYFFKGINYLMTVGPQEVIDNLTGNATILLHTGGIGPATLHNQDSLELEIQRRRVWSLYLAQCLFGDRLQLFEPIANIKELTLPWPEDDYENGIAQSPRMCLESSMSHGGVFAELIRAMTLW
jgi:hypothetical protein